MVSSTIFPFDSRHHTCQSRFFGLFENSPVSMLLFSPEGYVRAANTSFKKMFYTSAEDLMAANFNLLGHGKILASGMAETIFNGFHHYLVELPQTILFAGESVILVDKIASGLKSCIYPVKDERGDVLEVVLVHLDAYGGPSAAQLLSGINLELESRIRKRTERFNALNQELMRLRLKEDAAVRARDEFFSDVSHELKTPLTAIKEASSMLSQEISQNQASRQEELISILQEECERLICSVDSMLDASKIREGLWSYHFKFMNISPVICECVKRLGPIAEKKGIQVRVLSPSSTPLVRLDREKISLVMVNLMGNALKFTPSGGRITIRVSPVKDDSPGITVSVSDTGTGIPKQSLDAIFNRFIQADQGEIRLRGSGLGLFIVRKIILDHGGEIWADSRPGKGSQFYFKLPLGLADPDLVSPSGPGQGQG